MRVQYPACRNLTLRLLEPLGAPEQAAEPATPAGASKAAAGASIHFENVSVRVAGHMVLHDVSLEIPGGSHVAIVGPSGAGKSSLVGLLLGWRRPAAGSVRVDDAPLDGMASLRRQTAWVDPAVHLFNRSLFENLCYGASQSSIPMSQAIEAAELKSVLESLPGGFETRLGEGGALVSGGEGQRVRLARAMLRGGVRLAILDEPFRGLDREQRRQLLARVRRLWRDATLLCITHDIAETLAFDRVLVLEGGRLVEQGEPARLARAGGRYGAMIEAEEAVRTGLWSGESWRRLCLREGRLNG